MNIAELEALKAVAETGSFTRAANHLGMSQPGLSRQIQRLERELGTRLLERRGTGAILTDAGRESMNFAIRTISDFDALVSRFGPDPSALTGHQDCCEHHSSRVFNSRSGGRVYW